MSQAPLVFRYTLLSGETFNTPSIYAYPKTAFLYFTAPLETSSVEFPQDTYFTYHYKGFINGTQRVIMISITAWKANETLGVMTVPFAYEQITNATNRAATTLSYLKSSVVTSCGIFRSFLGNMVQFDLNNVNTERIITISSS